MSRSVIPYLQRIPPTARLCLLIACAAAPLMACRDLTFFKDDGSMSAPPVENPTPVVMDDFVFHRYSGTAETQRIHGREAVLTQSANSPDQRIEFTSVMTYFYQGDDPYCQVAWLKSDRARLYLNDEASSPPAYRQNDIDFSGNVLFLHRRGYRMETDQMRYDSALDALTCDRLSTTSIVTSSSVICDAAEQGFEFYIDELRVHKRGGLLRSLQDPEASQLRQFIDRQIAETQWTCGPDDTPSTSIVESEEAE